MNKNDWTYKKLGQVAEIVGGSTPKTNVKEYWGGDNYWVTPAEIGEAVYVSKTNRTISDSAVESCHLTLMPAGTVLLSSRAPIGKLGITTVPMYCNQGFKNIICSKQLHNKYVYYYLGNIVPYIQSLGRGATFKEVSKKIVEGITIPVPPKETQIQIVSELDYLNDSITMLQQQVKDLDSLALSIFYDMFGDPVLNDKGWITKKIFEIATVKTGPFGSMLHKNDYITGGIPLVNPIHMKGFSICPDHDFTISNDKAKELSNYILKTGDIVLARRGDIGRCAVVNKIENGYLCGTGSLFIRFSESTESNFIMYIVKAKSFTDALIKSAKGATMLNLNSTVVGNLRLILPPISIQQSFSSKVTAIEEVKAGLNSQIAEMQTLLSARMQYWFE